MKSKPPTPPPEPETILEVRRQVKRAPDAIIEMIAAQLDLTRNCRERIAREGEVVRDMRGSVIAHPAIKIAADATTLAAKLLKDWAGSR